MDDRILPYARMLYFWFYVHSYELGLNQFGEVWRQLDGQTDFRYQSSWASSSTAQSEVDEYLGELRCLDP